MQVFIHDPLYKWALSPLKALQRQKVIETLLHVVLRVSVHMQSYGPKI